MRTGKAAMRIVDVFRTLEYVGRAEGDKKSYCVFEGPHAYLVVASNTARSYNANVVEREAVDLLLDSVDVDEDVTKSERLSRVQVQESADYPVVLYPNPAAGV